MPLTKLIKRKRQPSTSSAAGEEKHSTKKRQTNTRKTFEQRMDDLRAYKEKHGHINVKEKEDKSLYGFCYNMRYSRNNPVNPSMTLTDNRIASLEALGFEWTVKEQVDKSFEQRIKDLKAYTEKHGHIKVKKSDDKSLYNFCQKTRYARNNPEKSTMLSNEERIASLDALGFEWTVKKQVAKSFEQRINDLQAYKEKHGHISIKKKEDSSLYQFCYNVRHAHKNPEKSDRTLNDFRIASLNALGFKWTAGRGERRETAATKSRREMAATKSRREMAATKSFEKRMDDLRAYKEKHGHVNVKKSDDKSLYWFCNNMRQARNNSEKSTVALTDDRIASLDALGFEWSTNANNKSFEQRIADLQAYKEKHGHVNVKGSEDKSLYKFCSRIKYARKHPEKKSTTIINDDRIASLDALGFDWILDSRIKSFEQRIADLKSYKEKNGHIKVKKSEDKSLYDFCSNIRNARNNPEKSTMTLTDERIASLNALGFDWVVIGTSFEQRIEDLRTYKEKHGHINVKKSDDKSLYDFCSNIRKARNNPEKSTKTVNEERIASLNALGFEWTPERGAKSFEQRIADLKAYKEKNWHVNVKQSEDRSLYYFCYNMRLARNNPGKTTTLINKERIASLDDLGFDWNNSGTKLFEQRIEYLRAYKEKHGHINVKEKEDTSLYEFCKHMRRARNYPENSTTLINEDRMASLDALGFDWKMRSDNIRSATSKKQVKAEENRRTAHNSSPSCSMVNNPSKETDEEIPPMPTLPPPNNANVEKDTGDLLDVETAGEDIEEVLVEAALLMVEGPQKDADLSKESDTTARDTEESRDKGEEDDVSFGGIENNFDGTDVTFQKAKESKQQTIHAEVNSLQLDPVTLHHKLDEAHAKRASLEKPDIVDLTKDDSSNSEIEVVDPSKKSTEAILSEEIKVKKEKLDEAVKRATIAEQETVKLTEDAFLAKKTSEAALHESENLKDRLKCPVCFVVKEEMYVLMTCGHKICFECYWRIKNMECPTCRRKLKKESHVMKRLY